LDKKTIIAVLLIIAVFWISSELLWKPKQKAAAEAAKLQTQAQVEQTNISNTEQSISEPIKTVQPGTPITSAMETQTIPVNNEIILENESVKFTFSNQGGVITSILLHDYFLKNKVDNAELIPPSSSVMNTEIITHSGSLINLRSKMFEYSTSSNSVTFTYTDEGCTFRKIFTLGDKYGMDFTIEASGCDQAARYKIGLDSGIADTEEFLKMKTTDYKTVSQTDNVLEKFALRKLKETKELHGKVDWAVIRSKYFMIGLIPNELVDADQITAFKVNNSPALKMRISNLRPNFTHNYQIYAGPLNYKQLSEYGVGIENSVEMGWKFIQWISKLFMLFFSFLSGFIPSWGIVIVIFAIVLKLVLYPLTHKSFESTTKMQKIQPLLKDVQAKYKHDPKTLNIEMKKLYKEHGVNPMGGCLPMLLQMPVFFALYPILRYPIDLRQASFMWLPDLSEPDPYLILPIAMAVFMFVQQKLMAPSKQSLEEMDEKQKAAMQSQKMMMYVMPVMMFFLFRSFPSGLVLYWTLFNVMSSVQQYFIKKSFHKD
jgi:YidC/Oxa1 family membrane protein insertase